MAVIGTFVATNEGGWAGSIRTLMIDIKVRFVPNDNKENNAAPTFRILAGPCEVGAAWRRPAEGGGRDYLSVRLFDPSLPEAISAALFEADDGKVSRLVWNNKR